MGTATDSAQMDYISYLLRLWSTTCADGVIWRASLENPLTGERRAFASLHDLLIFLRRQTGVFSDTGGGDQR
jgi:hypothetical protein